MRTQFVRWATISAIGIAPAACSIFSGWGDLEGGARHGADGGTSDAQGNVPPEASLAERNWPYPCTAKSCAGQACCLDLAAPGQASCESSCAGATLVAVRCMDEQDCTSSPKGKTCCVFATNPTTWNQVDCTSSCDGEIACDPAAPTACAPGKQCVPNDLQSLYTCH